MDAIDFLLGFAWIILGWAMLGNIRAMISGYNSQPEESDAR